MASTSHPPVAFSGSLVSKTSASDLLRSSRNGVCGVPLKTLGRARLGSKKRDFTISAKVRKVKKHEYPWPEDPDLNVKGGVLSHLSPFKPLKEKPKPVTLDFEKPLMDLQKKIIDVQKMANETGLDFSDQIISLENKYQQALKDLYTHLTPIQRVNIARHPNRPTFLDHIFNITEKFVELHGDRAGYDDPAIVTGLGTINGRSYMFMGHQKGRNTKENIQRNFGMPTPHGYRKALRMMYYADHHGFPIITFIDTPGAYADLKSEELGQGEAIAHNLRSMFGLKVPIISIVMGEGGSGGALAIGCANKLLMLENAVFYVASPEACAAILWKTAKASPKAAEKLKITAQELCRLQIADGSIPEPLGGAHADPYWTSQQIKIAIEESMDELTKMDTQELLRHRTLKFRKLGGFQEGVPIDPKRKVNMKKKEEPLLPPGIPDVELMDEVEKLKQEILKAKESTGKIPDTGLNEMIEKLRREIDYEFSEAAKALGLEEKLVMAREEFAKTRNSNDQSMHPVLKEKLDQLKDEFDRNISAAPNYASLTNKLEMLQEMSKAQKLSEKNSKVNNLKEEINKRLKEVMDRPDLKEKMDALKAEIKSTGVSRVRLVLAHNQFFDKIPSELGQSCSTLEELDLSGNRLTGELPSTFKLCSSLFSLNLGNNELSGDFLNTVISSLTNLRYLYLPFNNITGYVPKSLVNCTKLQVLDLSSNAFIGNVPSEFCFAASGFPLETMLLASNYLTGTVPKQLGHCRNLRKIDLSFNNLVGSIPLEIWNLPNLSELVMWANNLTGEIPEGICINGGNLQTLILNNNFISGTLPQSISKCTNLVWVSLSSNRLSGEIPQGIGNLANLAILQLGNNSLTGPIPRGLGSCRNLIWLDLNSNALTGSIPLELADQAGHVNPGMASGKQFAFVRNEGGTECRGAGGLVEFEGIREERLAILPMVHFCPSTRIYSGRTMYTFTSNGSMIYLDLSYNSLSGTIPDNLGSLSFLQVLNLGHNNFTGTIPFNFGGLKIVGVLDLSHNSLQGFIPPSLGGLSFLSDLDVSNNNLSGTIPSGGQLTTFPASRYENNSGLCGVPLPPCGSGNGHHSSSIYHHGNKKPTTIGMVVGIMVSFICIILLVIALYKIKKTQNEEEKRDKYIDSLPTSGSSSWKLSTVPEPLSINVATFEKPLRKLTFGHLLEATNGFSSESMIGSGGFGEVYKAQLRDGSTVAIKKLVHVTGQGDREFMAEMETIGKIKHRNLVPLLGYCKIGEERLLVYEYMKWGSLESVLHDGGKGGMFLDWPARKKIAIGSARGLAFLHHSCIPHIIHRDMKSSNVLLDENFEARVSDFGMARLVNALDTHLSVSTLAGTPGYVPPEYYQSFRCTAKGDVYSYGVILLELLSGKRPIDPRVFGDDNNLVGWAKQLHNDKQSHEILDPQLITNLSGDAELYHYLKVAFECLDEKSYKRPTMIQVMTKFKEVQTDSESDILDGISVKGSILEESQEREP